MTRRFAFVVATAIAAACAGEGDQQAATGPVCLSQDGTLDRGASFDERAGEYRLTLVATSGDSAGHEVTGALWLEPNDSAARRFSLPGGVPDPTVTVPLFGWSDVAVTGVAARQLGDLGSHEPASPGVLLLEQRADAESQPSITPRLGSFSNRRDVAPFEAGYTALRVGWLDESGGFGGTWASGVRDEEAGGHFCAVPAG